MEHNSGNDRLTDFLGALQALTIYDVQSKPLQRGHLGDSVG